MRTILLAGEGNSRAGVSLTLGIASGMLEQWLCRGRAQPDEEPYGSWSREYLASERMTELMASRIEAEQLAYVAKKTPAQRGLEEVKWVSRYKASKFPAQHGDSASGTGQLRVIDAEPDADAWWQKHGLQLDQLRALLRDPPEALAAALLAEGYTRAELPKGT